MGRLPWFDSLHCSLTLHSLGAGWLVTRPLDARGLARWRGTGDVKVDLAGLGREVTGLEFSEPMLAVGDQRLKVPRSRQGAGEPPLSVRFLRGDAQQIPFPDA